MEIQTEVEFAAQLTNDEIYQKIKALFTDVTTGFVGDFSVDFDAQTVLWYCGEDEQHFVNQFFIVGRQVELGAMPIMAFARGTL